MKIILNIATHGDERIGLAVAREIEKLSLRDTELVVQIANEKALKLGVRFIDQDLNRSFPGKKEGNHEERLAFELSKAITRADIVIDIHSTTSDLKDAVIVTKLDGPTIACVNAIAPKYALVMTATKDNALISQARIGIAFEYGKDNDPVALKKTILGIQRLLSHVGALEQRVRASSRVATRFFDVASTVPKPDGFVLLKGVKNYQLLRAGTAYATNGTEQLVADEDFYPILFGEKKYKDYFGFRATEVRF